MSELREQQAHVIQAARTDKLADDTAVQLKMAGQVQRAFLPAQLPNSEKLYFATVYRPADWVSGDIYDVARLDEQHIGFYIADAVGHSMPAALLTMFLKQAIVMRETTGNDYRIFSPAEVVRNLNDRMVAQNLGGSLFATCCYCLLNVDSMQLTYARAGHPYPVLIRNGQEPVQLKQRGGLLGIFPEAEFEQETIQLERGDKIFIYSDGCDPMVGECDDEGEFVFDEMFISITDKPVEQIPAEFEALVNDRNIPSSEIDDITALALEIM
jgi:sigma-B regulation protein RsbU (phosphoserine phosphatase)